VTPNEIVEAVRVLRDEVLNTAEHSEEGDPPGAEVFDAVLRALTYAGEPMPGVDIVLQDAVSRRLAWGDREEVILADAQTVFDRLLVAADRAFRRPEDRMMVIEAATQMTVAAGRVVALAAVTRASRDRAARISEELAQRQLKQVLERLRATIKRLEQEVDR
jgi:hypothetical protein